MRIKKLLVVGLLCAAFATLCIDMTGCGGSSIATKLNTWLCEEVEKRTEGRVKVNY